MGVPVSPSRQPASSSRSAWARSVVAFFTAWASSSTSVPKWICLSASLSRVATA